MLKKIMCLLLSLSIIAVLVGCKFQFDDDDDDEGQTIASGDVDEEVVISPNGKEIYPGSPSR